VRSAKSLGDSAHLRTYTTRSENIECSIIEALAATIASPNLFDKEVTVKSGSSYVGAELGINNPIRNILMEAEQIYGPSRQVGCLLSIGTVDVPLSHDILDSEYDKLTHSMLKAIVDCRETATAMSEKLSNATIYQRLSVQGPLHCARIIDWGRVDFLSLTQDYLQKAMINGKIDACIELILNSKVCLSLENLSE
jgi:hypothetical protein